MSQPSCIHVVAKPGRAHAINTLYQLQLGGEFLIWTRAQIAARIREVNAGTVESLSHLRGRLKSIADWNQALPEMAEGHGNILIADHEATLTPMQLLGLRKQVLFIERCQHEFDQIEGMEVARMLLGGVGRQGIGVVAPTQPKSEIYLLCVRHKKLELWTQFYRFQNEPSPQTWAALKCQTVPWRTDRTVESLVQSLPDRGDRQDIPCSMELRRALMPAQLAVRTQPSECNLLPLTPLGKR